MVLPTRGLTHRHEGFYQGEEPARGKERVRPALMVAATSATSAVSAMAQDAPQPHAYPAVELPERAPSSVFEVGEPAPPRSVHVVEDAPQRAADRAFRLGADGVLELVQALLPW